MQYLLVLWPREQFNHSELSIRLNADSDDEALRKATQIIEAMQPSEGNCPAKLFSLIEIEVRF